MRLGVIDVGSNTVHLLVVDAHAGARPLPASSRKEELRLAEHLDDGGRIDRKGADRLVAFVTDARELADEQGVEDLFAFATSALRDAPNGAEVLARVRDSSGVDLQTLDGPDEARLTFLAVRRWFGWSAGRLLVLDIGGGSLEVAGGIDEEPDLAVSLPLGAGRLTRTMLTGDPPSKEQVKDLRKHVRAEVARHARAVALCGTPDRVVGTSKTFRSLARVCGAAPSGEGDYVRRVLPLEDLQRRIPDLCSMSAEHRAALPGVSRRRAAQLLAGAVVAEAAMDLFGVAELEICPWALREGLLLRRLDWMDAGR